MMPEFYQKHMLKFILSFLIAVIVMPVLGWNDAAAEFVTNLLGHQAVRGIQFACFLVLAFNVALANLKTEDEINRRS